MSGEVYPGQILGGTPFQNQAGIFFTFSISACFELDMARRNFAGQ